MCIRATTHQGYPDSLMRWGQMQQQGARVRTCDQEQDLATRIKLSAALSLGFRKTESTQGREATCLTPFFLAPSLGQTWGDRVGTYKPWSGFLVVRERTTGFLSVSWWPFPYFIFPDSTCKALRTQSGGLADLTTREYWGAETGWYLSGGSQVQLM